MRSIYLYLFQLNVYQISTNVHIIATFHSTPTALKAESSNFKLVVYKSKLKQYSEVV